MDFFGDVVNDAVALLSSTVGIAVGKEIAVSAETVGVSLVGNRICDVVKRIDVA